MFNFKFLREALIVAGLSIAGVAVAGDADFKLVNRTGYDIESVYVAPSKSKSWGEDFIKKRSFKSGQSMDIEFSKRSNTCVYDMLVHWVGYGADEDVTWERLNLCEISKITLRYNKKTNETFVDTE
jgi:hypothetical protein